MSFAQPNDLRKRAVECVLEVLPLSLRSEVLLLGDGKACYSAGLSEIRVRAGEISLAVFFGKNFPLFVPLTRRDIEDTLARIHKGALYMHKETIARGFLSMEYGVRVGIVGTADRKSDAVHSVGEPSSLVFRLPLFDSSIGAELSRRIEVGGRIRSALIYSPPAGGKTTAIRSLSLALSVGGRRRVVVVDERREFPRELYTAVTVDILSGFCKSEGVELATRVLNPEIIVIDELGSAAEARSVKYASLCGVPIIATVHAGSIAELKAKEGIAELLADGVFELLIELGRKDTKYTFTVKEVEEL